MDFAFDVEACGEATRRNRTGDLLIYESRWSVRGCPRRIMASESRGFLVASCPLRPGTSIGLAVSVADKLAASLNRREYCWTPSQSRGNRSSLGRRRRSVRAL